METRRFDVVVVGAGSAGACAALHLAESGRSVAVIDRSHLHDAGASWLNGIAPWMFERAGIAIPRSPERKSSGAAFHLLDFAGRGGVTVLENPLLQVDMRALVARLQARAMAAGAEFHTGARIGPVMCLDLAKGERLHALEVDVGGKRVRYEAALFVDAAGFSGVLRSKISAFREACPRLSRDDVCSAAQEVRRIGNLSGARSFLERAGANSGDAVGYMGRDGGYSTLVVTVDLEEGTVDLLSGAIASSGFRSGPRILADFVAEESWIGEVVFGGSGAIPLRRPYDCFVAPGVALVGDAAAQVFPAHGSGVGTGLVAGRMLAEAVGGDADPGRLESLWSYQKRYMREIGSVSAAYDVFRRLSQSLTPEEIAALLDSGLMTAASSRSALTQEMPAVDAALLIATLRGVARAPRLALRLGPTILRMQAVHRFYKRFPANPSAAVLKMWSQVARALGGWEAGQGDQETGRPGGQAVLARHG